MIEKLGGRKFILASVALIFAFVLAVVKLVQPKEFLDFAAMIVGIFTVGNAVVDGVSILNNK